MKTLLIILQTKEQWDAIRPLVYVLAGFVVLFFVIRELMLWYWKVNTMVQNQQEQIRLLKKIAGENEQEEESATPERFKY